MRTTHIGDLVLYIEIEQMNANIIPLHIETGTTDYYRGMQELH